MPASRLRHLVAAAALAAAAPALADAPGVVADIAPVQSIAAAVMAGVGVPALIVPPGASEHHHALRPSEAGALEAADLVVWVGPALTPWLEDPLDALAPDAARLTLVDVPGLRLLPFREGGPFEAHDHDHDREHGHEHGHDEHGHDHDAPIDPHVWLDPANAAAIAAAIADALGAADPENAAAYAANAAAFAADMQALRAEIGARVAPLSDRPFFVFHDAYQYFETAFDLPAAGSVALGDADAPRAARVAEIRDRLTTEDVACIFAEPQFEPRLIPTLVEGTQVRIGQLDPLGATLRPGPELYPTLMRNLADGLAACLAPGD